MEELLAELTQLLVGIAIMQVRALCSLSCLPCSRRSLALRADLAAGGVKLARSCAGCNQGRPLALPGLCAWCVHCAVCWARAWHCHLLRAVCGRCLWLCGTSGSQVQAEALEQESALKPASWPQEVTPRAQDSLVSFGERLSTRLFSAFLRAQVGP